MTGSSDGVVRMWSLDFVEVAITDNPMHNDEHGEVKLSDNETTNCIPPITQLAKKMSLNNEYLDKDTLNNLQHMLASNAYATTTLTPIKKAEVGKDLNTQSDEEEECSSDTEEICQENDTLDNTTDVEDEEDKSIYRITPTSESECVDENQLPKIQDGEYEADLDHKNIAKNEEAVTSTANDAGFVIVPIGEEVNEGKGDADEEYGNSELGSCGGRRPPRRCRLESDGYTWSRQLVFRAKLTMHTAFERPDNIEPAAVTALAVSKDHRTIYVGDEKGRVFSWSVSSRPGKGEREMVMIDLPYHE